MHHDLKAMLVPHEVRDRKLSELSASSECFYRTTGRPKKKRDLDEECARLRTKHVEMSREVMHACAAFSSLYTRLYACNIGRACSRRRRHGALRA